MRRLKLAIGLAAMLLGIGEARAQAVTASETVAIEAELARVVQADGPGCVVGVKRVAADVFIAALGLASVELGQPLTAESVFDIASNGKQFAATVILQMQREGKLGLDDEVQKHLPDFPRYGQPITLYHLLHHTSGVRDFDSLRMLSRTEDETTATTDDVTAVLWRQRGLNFAPGSDFAYSNSNYVLLARIAETIDGLPYPEIVEGRVFRPLGLKRTRHKTSYADVVQGRATPYVTNDGKARLAVANWTVYGTGSIYSSVGDMLTWLEQLIAPDAAGRDLAEALLRPGRLTDETPLGYSAGLVADRYRSVARHFHNGGSAGYRSTLMIYPDKGLATAILCNSGNVLPNHLSDRVADVLLFLGANDVRSPATGPSQGETDGLYYSQGLDAYRWLEKVEGGTRVKQTPSDPGRVYAGQGGGLFVEPASGAKLVVGASSISLDDNLKHPSRFSRVSASPGGDRAPPVPGDYRSDEIDTRLAVREDAEGPYVSIEPVEPFMRASDTIERRLSPMPDGAWMSDNGWVVRFPTPDTATISIGRLVRFPLTRQSSQ